MTCTNPSCNHYGKTSTGSQTLDGLSPTAVVISRSPSPLSRSVSRSRSPSPIRRKRLKTKRGCHYIMIKASKALCNNRNRRKYAKSILGKKKKKKKTN